jgi:hypothetical protein
MFFHCGSQARSLSDPSAGGTRRSDVQPAAALMWTTDGLEIEPMSYENAVAGQLPGGR